MDHIKESDSFFAKDHVSINIADTCISRYVSSPPSVGFYCPFSLSHLDISGANKSV